MVVVHVVLLFGSESLVLLSAIETKVEGTHTSFLCQITGRWAQWNPDGNWVTLAAGEIPEAVWMKSAATYIGLRKVSVSQWVELHSIFEVCTRYQVYEGGGGG